MMQRRELRRNEVRIIADVGEACPCRDWELRGVSQTRIVKRAFSVHLNVGNKCVPMRDRTPAGPSMKIDARKPKRRRNQRRSRATIGTKRFAIEKQLRIKLTRSPR